MTIFVFAVLIGGASIGIAWGTLAVAVRQSPPEQVAREETGPESDWPIAPAPLRCGDRRGGAQRFTGIVRSAVGTRQRKLTSLALFPLRTWMSNR
jgi:hypothetical protein